MLSSKLIKFFAVIAGLQFMFALFAFSVLSRGNPVLHAVFGMGLGLFVFWIILFGLFTWKQKDRVRAFVLRISINWQTKFILFCTLLALLEEAVAVLMSNFAPWFGVAVGQAYITASANYWDVVLGHSVILFVPVFIAWAYLFSKYDFTPNQAFLLFGITGTLAEVIYSGPQHFFEIGMWMFVYGLMIYLPAYSIPQNRQVRAVRWYHFVLPFVLAALFQVLFVPVVPLIKHLRPSVSNSFPPMQAK